MPHYRLLRYICNHPGALAVSTDDLAQELTQLFPEAVTKGTSGKVDILNGYLESIRESGDQAVLDAMGKGTRLTEIDLALEKLAEARAHQVEVVRREVVAEARGAATRYRVAQEQRQAMAQQASEYAELSRTAAQGYEVGLLGLVEVLDATSAYRRSLRDYIEAEADFHRARAELWWAVGRSLDRGADE